MTESVPAKVELAVEILPAVTTEGLRAYSEAARDPNPIHLDEAAAKANGLPGIIAHGMWVAAWVANRAHREAAAQGLRLRSFQVRFRGMTVLGDELRIGGSRRAGAAALDLWAKNARGELVCTAVAELG